MRWLVGWSSAAAGISRTARTAANGSGEGPVHPVGSQLLWGGPDPLWAVGDWRPDEIRMVQTESPALPFHKDKERPVTRIAVLGCCGASDDELRAGLVAARGGALRHLTSWPGSYTAVVRSGRRITVIGDLAGARPVFHTPWDGGTAYATAALPLADLVEAQLDVSHLAALLACPDSPEALGDGTPYLGVRRIPPGHALILREGAREITSYEPAASLAVAAPQLDAPSAVEAIRDALVEAVRVRLAAPRHAPESLPPDPGPVPGMGPAERRAARGAPAPGVGADLSGGSASATLALLAAGLPGNPGTILGQGTGAGERLLAVTLNDLATGGGGAAGAGDAELERARSIAENPRLHHVVVAAGEEALPYAGLDTVFLTDEPGPSLVTAARHRFRLTAGSADHIVGHGARQVLDAHPARLADLLLDRQRRRMLRPMAALARADGPTANSLFVPFTVYRAARKLARTPYREGVRDAAERLLERRFAGPGTDSPDAGGHGPHGNSAVDASLAALAWCRPGPAARWLTGEALAEVAFRLQGAAARPGTVERPGERRASAALARCATDHRVFEQAAEVRNQRLHAPFFDNQVVRACRALPEAVRVQPGARASVLRSVLASTGIRDLPPGWGAPSQAAQAAAVRAGLRAAVGGLMELFDAPLLADAGLVEARVVRKALRAAVQGEPVPLDGLAELVSTELWLRRLIARRGSCWTGSEAPRQRAVSAGVPVTERPAL